MSRGHSVELYHILSDVAVGGASGNFPGKRHLPLYRSPFFWFVAPPRPHWEPLANHQRDVQPREMLIIGVIWMAIEAGIMAIPRIPASQRRAGGYMST